MGDAPILFSAPMIRALLDGRKTQTRRVLKLPAKTASGGSHYERPDVGGWEPAVHGGGGCFTIGKDGQRHPVPEMVGMYHGTCGTSIVAPIQRGDRLWVRETWWIATRYSYGSTPGGIELPPPPLKYRKHDPVHYAADGAPPNCPNRHYGQDGLRGGAYAAPDPYATWVKNPSIHMTRWASRLTLYVTDVRVQRLQDLSEADAIAEGIEKDYAVGLPNIWGWHDYLRGDEVAKRHFGDPGISFRSLWESINGPGAWDVNPWVAAYTFEVRHGNIDSLPAEFGEAS